MNAKASSPNRSDFLRASLSPHIFDDSYYLSKVMWIVIAALLPACFASIYFFGLPAFIIIILCVISCVVAEVICLKLMNRPIRIKDGSAIITGLLIALMMPPTAPWYLPIFGSLFAIAITKHAFGGLGMNIFNPALMSRTFLLFSFPTMMTHWALPRTWKESVDGISSATPLGKLKMLSFELDPLLEAFHFDSELDLYLQLLIGNVSGSIGETSGLALLLGAVILIIFKVIDWRIPLSFLLTFVLFSWLGGLNIVFQIFSGGFLLALFFMATDPVTSPVTSRGRFIFGIGCGIGTVVFRMYGGNPEGVSYAILFMNAMTPLIDRFSFAGTFSLEES